MWMIFKAFMAALRELVFDREEEYDYRSKRFDSRKVMTFFILALSFLVNGWLLVRFFQVASQTWECQHRLIEVPDASLTTKASPPKAKKLRGQSLDSEAESTTQRLPTP